MGKYRLSDQYGDWGVDVKYTPEKREVSFNQCDMKQNKKPLTYNLENRTVSVNDNDVRPKNSILDYDSEDKIVHAGYEYKDSRENEKRLNENFSEDLQFDMVSQIGNPAKSSTVSDDAKSEDFHNGEELKNTELKFVMASRTFDENADESNVIRKRSAYQIAANLMQDYCFVKYNNELYVGKIAHKDERLLYYDLVVEGNCCIEIRSRITGRDRCSISSPNDIQEIVNWIRTDAEEIECRPNEDVLMFENMAYDWRRKQVVEDTRGMFIRGKLNTEYYPGASSTNVFNDFVSKLFDQETIPYFYQFLGLAISEVRQLKYVFYLLGDPNSGKSTIGDLIMELVGSKYVSHVSFNNFTNEYYLSVILSAKINISSEVSGAGGKRAENLQSLSGNKTITTSKKYKDPYDQKARALLVFETNSLPVIRETANLAPLLERFVFLPMKKTVQRAKWDPYILDKIKNDMSAVIDAALEGLRALKDKEWVFGMSSEMQTIYNTYCSESNSFLEFVEKSLEVTHDRNDVMASCDIDYMYERYCRENGIKYPLPQNQRSGILQGVFRLKKSIIERGIRGYKGIKSTETATYSKEDEWWAIDETQEE